MERTIDSIVIEINALATLLRSEILIRQERIDKLEKEKSEIKGE